MHMRRQPYLELYRGHLFTIPDALCYECDVCEYVEFDDALIEIMGDMVFGISLPFDNDPIVPQRATDEDMPKKPKHPSL